MESGEWRVESGEWRVEWSGVERWGGIGRGEAVERGVEGGWVVFQKKSVSWKSLIPRRGGPAESHREYYVGEGFLGSPPAQEAEFSRGARPHELIGAYGSRRCHSRPVCPVLA